MVDWRWENGDFSITPRGDVALARGLEVVRQDLLARLISPRGSHWAFPLEGSRVPEFVQAPMDELSTIELLQEAELSCLEDVRILRAEAALEGRRIRIRAELAEEAVELLLADPRRPA